MNETWWVDPSQLDEKQVEILTELPETEMLIAGPPGSGKTNILMLRANYVRSVAPRTLFLTFTRTLAEFLRSGPNVGRGDQLQQEDIKTFMGWSKQVIRDLGGKAPSDSGDFDTDRQGVIEMLNEMIEQQGPGQLYDVAFIDEVQDFLEAELNLVRRLAVRINAAGDSRQRIWSHREGLPTIRKMVEKQVVLEKHYRVGERICRYADQILPPTTGMVPLLEGCNYPEEVRPSSVDTHTPATDNEMFASCLANIKEQIRYITDEPIGVLAATTDVRDRFWEALQHDGELAAISMRQRATEYQAFGPDSLIRVMTVSSAKGSEFRAVHILNAEWFRTKTRELAFTAVTRAKTEVAIYHVAPLASHMVPPRDNLPDLQSIF